MVIVRATRELLPRLGGAQAAPGEVSDTLLGDWYVKKLAWRRQVALLVSESTLLPVLVPLAPAVTLLDRFPSVLAGLLRLHGLRETVVEREVRGTADYRLAPTASRSVIGSMNEFAFLADVYREQDAEPDLMGWSLRLATVPCGPLLSRHVSPDRELAALVDP
ncbi:hypothetical protein AVL62_00065 [Serinicoccus chungangensis]|uniref:DUF6933 domain-containing protein n=1 Tax=Serinicoccus chungangensis TaxID=767452 RepID=A0A0W8I664_9MICO|nr:hypothetical protein [Serinicoccus chungangensis]KUG53757.1 hypothetical protein AVL62_00065 [Serinicoccus chungangensis]